MFSNTNILNTKYKTLLAITNIYWYEIQLFSVVPLALFNHLMNRPWKNLINFNLIILDFSLTRLCLLRLLTVFYCLVSRRLSSTSLLQLTVNLSQHTSLRRHVNNIGNSSQSTFAVLSSTVSPVYVYDLDKHEKPLETVVKSYDLIVTRI